MQNSITWFDQLRSPLTGQPAKVYATRRLARADLHVLEAQRAHAVARLTEDIELIDRYVKPLERYMDGDRLLTPLGTILDRRSGKNLPLVWTELDLREFRRWARVICDVNPFAVGFLGLLTDFHIRQGFGWQVVLRGERGMGPGASQNEASSLLAPRPIPLAPIQALLDTWRDSQQWGIRSREAFRRWRRDGEVFLRFFRGGEQTRGLPVVRFVEPEQVGPPPGEDADGDWSFGILTDREDVENVQAFFVRDRLGTGSEGDEVPAARILHLKANVDSSIKRGLPDFMPVQDDLERVRRMLRNMGEVAAVQTAIAWVSQYATATSDQVGTLIRAGSDYTRPKLGDPSGKYMDVVNYEPGTVLHMDSNRQFVAGPVAQGTAGFIQVEQAILRGCGARWRFPEYFSGDASNNNMASSIVAGSPFVVAVEGNQLEWGVFERAVAKKVLELCVESGRLTREQVASVDVKVIPPAVALANRGEEERLREMRNKAGVLSVTTWQQQVGLDPKHEAANFEAEARRKGASEGGKTVGESEESECDEEISEGMLKGKKFTGEIRDSLGRRRCYRDGKQIACERGEEPKEQPDKPPKPPLNALQDAQKMEQQKLDDNRYNLGNQSLAYAGAKSTIANMKKAKNGAGEVIYGKAGYEKYTELVDEYEAITEELLTAPPIARTTSGIISRGRLIYHFKGPREGEELEKLPHALLPGTLSNIHRLLQEIEKQADEIRTKPRGLAGMAYGFAKASDNLVTGILELYKAPGALATLLTDAEAQKNLYEELKKGVGELRDGDAEAWGGAFLNIPLTITGAAGAAKGTAAVTRITLKVSKATAKKLVASGLKGKALIRALLKADVEEAAAAAKSVPKPGQPNFTPKTLEEHYAHTVMSNKPWSWPEDIPGGADLTAAQRKAIREKAVANGLIPNVTYKPGTQYLDFEKAGLVQRIEHLPPELWKASDKKQFEWLDAKIPGGRPAGTTWHHSEIDGRMELVPFGPHNIFNHKGGRSPGMWADAPR